MTDFTTTRIDAYAQLKDTYRLNYDAGDPWGYNISVMLQVCEYLHFERDRSPSDNVQYRPGIGSDIDDYWREVLDDASTEQIEAFLALLIAFNDRCRRQELDY